MVFSADNPILPEGLKKSFDETLLSSPWGVGLPSENKSPQVRYNNEVTECIKIKVLYEGKIMSAVDYYYNQSLCKISYLSNGVNSINRTEFFSYYAPYIVSKEIRPQDDKSTEILQPKLEIGLLKELKTKSQTVVIGKVGDWTYSAESKNVAMAYYTINYYSLNSSAVFEYYPSLGFYRWTFSQPVAGAKWEYVMWPKTEKKD